ncbi:MAG: hypothetical protein HY366_02825 [Candidatus Aenigmarchaeota archaeon]|nr:hypothetical protein [Candidatus Aenigmarchaeota archaeon]
MKLFRAAVFGAAGYGIIAFLFLITETIGLSRGPVAFGAVVLNFFTTSALAYSYFKTAGVGARNEGVILGVLWVSEAIVLEYISNAVFFGNALAFVTYAPFWVYNAERLLLPLAFSSGLIEVRPHQP